ncbi:MAG TPA: hypothetical protein VHM00_10450 [Caldimonas sp.]|jgi:hypothetical protein|nr:hypothetical protein [Caldimonas sp.]HEX2541489.1 hypothetical protein [Caldimonas sp.]
MPRLIPALAALAAAAVVCASCTLAADLRTDASGQIVGVSLVRLESSIEGLAVAMLISGRELAVQLAWGALDRDADGAGTHGSSL